MSESLTAETFRPHLESEFRAVSDAGDPAVLVLTGVTALGVQPEAPRTEPFTLDFTGPTAPVLEQRIHRLEHDELGSLEIFLVPIGFDPDRRVRYEAVFN
jgi:hypothetical protein